MTVLSTWAAAWRIPPEALLDLQMRLGVLNPAPVRGEGASESAVSSGVRLEVAARGAHVFRNNVGVLQDETGRPVRFGLANDSAALNRRFKSSDLIGWSPVVVQPWMVGTTIAQFLSLEVKHGGWRYSGTPREVAQLNWLSLVISAGGRGAFVSDPKGW